MVPQARRPPEADTLSMSRLMSIWSALMMAPEAPPVWTASSFLPSGTPPQKSMTSSFRLMPIGNSNTPRCLTLPLTVKSLVPAEPGTPILANSAPPMRKMTGRLLSVSTLFSRVGLPNRPLMPGKGGR